VNGTCTLFLAPNSVSPGVAGYLPAMDLGTFSNMAFAGRQPRGGAG
jgi:hypothetical protein